METILGLCMGLALAAACGMRVFAPMLVAGIAAKSGIIEPVGSLEWLSSWPALVALSTATLAECIAAQWPWLDHALDTIAAPAAIVAGTLMAAAQLDHLHPAMTWGMGLIAGGGAAGAVQATSMTTRGASTVTTAGFLNPVLNAIQSVVSVVVSVIAVVVPVVAGVILLTVAALVLRWWLKRRARREGVDEVVGVAVA